MFSVVNKTVKGMEKFLLCLRFTGDKLNIVNQKQVDIVSVFIVKFINAFSLKACDKFVCKIFSLYITNFHFGKMKINGVADSVEQMCFSQTAASVNEKGIVIVVSGVVIYLTCRIFADCFCRRISKTV